MNFLKALFIFLLLTIPFAQVGRLQLGSGVAITINDIVVAIIAIVWFGEIFSKKKLNLAPSKPIFVFIIVALLSLIINIPNLKPFELLVSALYLIRWVLYVCLFFVVASFDNKFKTKIAYLLMMASSILVLLGFIQYFLYSDLRNLYYLGWDEHIHRLFSSFLDPNFAGAFFVLYFLLLSGLLLGHIRVKRLTLSPHSIVLGALYILSLLAIYLTFSRSALIMLFVSMLVFLYLLRKLKWMFVLVFVFFIFFAFSSKSFHIENINLFRVASSKARIDSAKNAIQIIKDNPILGVGFNTYRYTQIRYGFRSREDAFKSHADAGTDNSFLFVFATTGVIGLLSYLYLLFSILRRAYARYKVNKRGEVRNVFPIVAIASFVGIIVDSLFINSLFYTFNMMWLWILVGLIDNKDPSLRACR